VGLEDAKLGENLFSLVYSRCLLTPVRSSLVAEMDFVSHAKHIMLTVTTHYIMQFMLADTLYTFCLKAHIGISFTGTQFNWISFFLAGAYGKEYPWTP
jgi:hypothetical protein